MRSSGKGGWDSGEIETEISTPHVAFKVRGKGGWDSGEIETNYHIAPSVINSEWKGWMGLRRD